MITFARSSQPSGDASAPSHGLPTLEPPANPAHVPSRRRRQTGLGDEIARLSALIEAARGQLLDLIRAFDESEEWYEQGFRSCALWLSWRTGIGPGAARERVRVARAVGDLPEMRAALGSGELSYSMARVLTRVATPENEAELVEAARHTTAADMERLVSAWRVADRSEEDERARHERCGLQVTLDADGSWNVRGRLGPEDGAVLCRALEAAGEKGSAVEDAGSETEVEVDDSAYARRAGALVLVAEAALGRGLAARSEAGVASRAERFQVVVHVSAETLAGGDEISPPRIERGPHVSAETSRRLACDASVVMMKHRADGSVLDVGRRRRTVSTPLRRALGRRDGGCRFPGCRSRFCDAHHIKHWAKGGVTALDNLVLLCRHHHRRVHEDGWRVALGRDGEARFYKPDGQPMPGVPAHPIVPDRPVRRLEQRHGRLGLEIDPWTPSPRWMGERLDVDWALFTLRRPVRLNLEGSAVDRKSQPTRAMARPTRKSSKP
ncbi:MAG: DUF222 domain-containing protein [Gemmatimonadota bacterium]